MIKMRANNSFFKLRNLFFSHHVQTASVLLPVLLSGSGVAFGSEIPDRPNVLFLSIDDLRPELGCYGQEQIHSPNIDRLAARSVVFERAYCQFSHCAPSRTSLLSGMRPGSKRNLPDLPEYFRRQGYFCASLGKIYHGTFGREYDRTNGNNPKSWSVPAWYPPPRFYFSDEGVAVAKECFSKKAQELGVPLDEWTNHIVRAAATEAPDVADNIPRDGQIMQEAVRRIQGMDGNQPFFLAVGLMGTHLPFVAPKKYWDLYPEETIQLPDNMFSPHGSPEFAFIPAFELGQYTGLRDIFSNEKTAKHLVRAYWSCVSYVDAMVGRILDALDEAGLRENTIVVLWGDNGWKLGEHNAWSKYSNCENDTRIPLMISVPGMEHGSNKRHALVELVDLYPTLCELCNLSVPDRLEGTSMLPLLSGKDRPWKKAVFSVMARNVKISAGGRFQGKGYSIRTDRYRLTLWFEQKNPNISILNDPDAMDHLAGTELYDHRSDPEENTNCAGNPEYAGVVEDLKKQLLAGWKSALPDRL